MVLSRVGAACVLHVRGELDFDTVPAFIEAVLAALDGACRLLVLDLAALEFCDSSGLDAMLDARANPHHTPLVLVAPTPPLLRVLEITGAGPFFVTAASIQHALACHGLPAT
ncbi:anti-sigma B factor antagonist [Kitasatospora sp. SolWspMP-SS2h]|uniref:STAS domain-containing protein n=1 Tax=Kitasatospora sp. SolWspMP-SS2h TaxID=1305729 RepID=UPI000DBFD35A|nr:STAS domain-containing protein [Kitasatospora sp. SolWspMP-SS2h]RAJ32828.1 anti-sigma B factor antagonist [Kitasatospora sp. SolWspMP-SS2h]